MKKYLFLIVCFLGAILLITHNLLFISQMIV